MLLKENYGLLVNFHSNCVKLCLNSAQTLIIGYSFI